jgi:hypothetical protein
MKYHKIREQVWFKNQKSKDNIENEINEIWYN